MSEYYAVQRSDNSLKHYGVRGMKWGVRKATIATKKYQKAAKKLMARSKIYKESANDLRRQNGHTDIFEKRNSKFIKKWENRAAKKQAKAVEYETRAKNARDRAITKQYNKAAKKLEKLNAKADVKTQAAKAAKYNKIAKRAGVVGAIGAATGVAGAGAYRLSKLLGAHYTTKAGRLINESVNSTTSRAAIKLDNAADHYSDLARKHWDTADKLYRAQYDGKGHALAGITAGALGVAAGSKIKAVAAKRRTTAKGHAKAIAKRNAWRKEMQSAFKGTQYANLPSVAKKKTNRQGKKRS